MLTRYKVTRINLSDQTDISDLFGADLPEEGGSAGHFVWRDGPFMTALKEGQWILLDEVRQMKFYGFKSRAVDEVKWSNTKLQEIPNPVFNIFNS